MTLVCSLVDSFEHIQKRLTSQVFTLTLFLMMYPPMWLSPPQKGEIRLAACDWPLSRQARQGSTRI
jgi:hypothetical protein